VEAGTELSALIAEAQAAYSSTPPLTTYFVVLNDAANDGANQVAFYNQIANAPGTGASVIDATVTQPEAIFASFQKSLADVATCLYDEPAGIDTTATVNFVTPPGIGQNVNTFPVTSPDIPYDSTCTATSSLAGNSGWNLDNGRIRICGMGCAALRATIGAAAASALPSGDAGLDAGFTSADGGPPVVPDVPVTVTMPCADGGAP
jgi:hypothetical protein